MSGHYHAHARSLILLLISQPKEEILRSNKGGVLSTRNVHAFVGMSGHYCNHVRSPVFPED
eukprot:12605669-Ditylum_brightwellii.AAC.1